MKHTDSTEQKGYDAGKKVSGIKRHILPWIGSACSMPHAIEVTIAHKRSGGWRLFRSTVYLRRQ